MRYREIVEYTRVDPSTLPDTEDSDPRQLRFDFYRDTDQHRFIGLLERHCKDYLDQCQGKVLYRGLNCRYEVFIKDVPQDRRPKDSSADFHYAYNQIAKDLGWKTNRSNSICTSGDIDTASGYGSEVYVVFPKGEFHFLWSNQVKDMYTHYQESDDYLDRSAYKDDKEEYLRKMEDYEEYQREYEQWQEEHSRWQYEMEEYENATEEEREDMHDPSDDEPMEPEEVYEPDRPRSSDYDKEPDIDTIKDDMRTHYNEDDSLYDAISSGHEVMIHCLEFYGVRKDYFEGELLPLWPRFRDGPVPDENDEE
jgi:hypothetical protein